MKKVHLLTLALAVSLFSNVALAADPQTVHRAQQLSDQAYEAYEAGDYPTALQHYQDSYQLVPSGEILFNIAKIYDSKLHSKELAIEYYRRYSASPDAQGDLVRQCTVRIAALETPSPRAQASTTESPQPADSASPGSGWKTAGIITGGVGIVGLGLGTFFGLSAKSKHDDAKNAGCLGTSCPDDASAKSEKDASSAATISTVGFIGGGILLAAGVTLFIIAPSKKASAPTSARSLQITPTVGPRNVGISFTGSMF